jgi:hypothetical protein
MGGDYTENLNINKNGITLVGEGTTGSQMVLVNGTCTVQPGVTRFRVINMQFRQTVAGQPILVFNGTLGRHYFDNVTFTHTAPAPQTDIQWIGTCQNWHDFNRCSFSRTLDFGGTPDTTAQAKFEECDGGEETNYNITQANWTVRIFNTYRVGQINHAAGELIVSNVQQFMTSTTDAIVSTANTGGKNRLLVSNTAFRQPGGTTKLINKTGTAEYLIWNCLRDVAGDTLNGSRLRLGTESVDIRNNVRVDTGTTVTVNANDHIIIASNAAGRTVNLPAGSAGRQLIVKDGAGTAGGIGNEITVTPNGFETVDDNTTFVINQNYGSVTLVWNGTQWNVI